MGTPSGRRARRSPARRRRSGRRPVPTAGWLAWLSTLLRAAVRPRADLVLENVALRHQLAVMRRSVKRPKLTNADRLVWIAPASVFPRWRECLLIVKPETVLRWHRKGWRAYWRWRSDDRERRPPPAGHRAQAQRDAATHPGQRSHLLDPPAPAALRKSCMLIVMPETVVRWHRKGAAYYWARKSRTAKRGAPAIGWKLVRFIQRLSTENVTWGAPRTPSRLRTKPNCHAPWFALSSREGQA